MNSRVKFKTGKVSQCNHRDKLLTSIFRNNISIECFWFKNTSSLIYQSTEKWIPKPNFKQYDIIQSQTVTWLFFKKHYKVTIRNIFMNLEHQLRYTKAILCRYCNEWIPQSICYTYDPKTTFYPNLVILTR